MSDIFSDPLAGARQLYSQNRNISDDEVRRVLLSSRSPHSEFKRLAKFYGYALSDHDLRKGYAPLAPELYDGLSKQSEYNYKLISQGKSALNFFDPSYDPTKYSDEDNFIVSDYVKAHPYEYDEKSYTEFYNRNKYKKDYDLATAEDAAAYEAGELPLKRKALDKIKTGLPSFKEEARQLFLTGTASQANIDGLLEKYPEIRDLNAAIKARNRDLSTTEPEYTSIFGSKKKDDELAFYLDALKELGVDPATGFASMMAGNTNVNIAAANAGAAETGAKAQALAENALLVQDELQGQAGDIVAMAGRGRAINEDRTKRNADMLGEQGYSGAAIKFVNGQGTEADYAGITGADMERPDVVEAVYKYIDEKYDEAVPEWGKNLGAGLMRIFDPDWTPEARRAGVSLEDKKKAILEAQRKAAATGGFSLGSLAGEVSPSLEKDYDSLWAGAANAATMGLFNSEQLQRMKEEGNLGILGEMAGSMAPIVGLEGAAGGALEQALPKLTDQTARQIIKGGVAMGAYGLTADLMSGRPAGEVAQNLVMNVATGGLGDVGFNKLKAETGGWLPKYGSKEYYKMLKSGELRKRLQPYIDATARKIETDIRANLAEAKGMPAAQGIVDVAGKAADNLSPLPRAGEQPTAANPLNPFEQARPVQEVPAQGGPGVVDKIEIVPALAEPSPFGARVIGSSHGTTSINNISPFEQTNQVLSKDSLPDFMMKASVSKLPATMAEDIQNRISNSQTREMKQKLDTQKKLQSRLDYLGQKYGLNATDKGRIDSIIKGEFDWEDAAKYAPTEEQYYNMRDYAAAKQEVDALNSEISQYRKSVHQARFDKAESLLKGSDTWRDKKTPLQYAREIQERNIEDIAPAAEAERIKNEVLQKVHADAAQATRFKDYMRGKIRALKLTGRESELVHRMGEGKFTPDDIPDPKTAAKIDTAIGKFRELYDQMFDLLNDSLVRNGYDPVEKRVDYYPHFNEPDAMIDKVKKAFGIDITNAEIPSDIIGQTEYFRPGKNYFGHIKRRTGYDTTFDAVKGFERYIDGASRIIYMTDDIQQLRAMEAVLRQKASEKGIADAIKELATSGKDAETINDGLSSLYSKLDDINAAGANNVAEMTPEQIRARRYKLPNYLVNLNEYTNLLAGKKSALDRSFIDHALGRPMYKLLNWFQRRTGMNMVAANLSSAMTNFIPMTQALITEGAGNVRAAMRDTVKSVVRDDGFKYKSDFLTNRFGSKPLAMTGTEKAADILGTPFRLADEFTSNVITRTRYMGGLEKGMTAAEAMRYADDWAARAIGDRSIGAKPTLFDSKVLGIVTQFQLEVNNQLSFLLKDIPKELRNTGAAHISGAIIKWLAYSYMYNQVMEAFTGRKNVAIDPVGLATGFYEDSTGTRLPIHPKDLIWGAPESKEGNLIKAGGNLLESVINNTPFTAGVATIAGMQEVGRLPVSAGIPNIPDMFVNGNVSKSAVSKELLKPVTYYLPPFGGSQLKKTIESIVDIAQGGEYGTNAKGERYLKFPADNKNIVKDIQGLIFGKYATQEGKKYIESGFRTLTPEQTNDFDALRAEGVPVDPLWDAFLVQAMLKPEEGKKSVSDAQREAAIRGIEGLTGSQKDRIVDVMLYDEPKAETTQKKYDYMTANGVAREKADLIYIARSKLKGTGKNGAVKNEDINSMLWTLIDAGRLTRKEAETAFYALTETIE